MEFEPKIGHFVSERCFFGNESEYPEFFKNNEMLTGERPGREFEKVNALTFN
ncbi:hypothetical protein AEAC466_12275 [Asticcacaulis sp. AC466]|nr:hypothetical protein AEAC466_12275 [Asticcacaulis sp. AC466]